MICVMRIRLYNPGKQFTFAETLIVSLPSDLPSDPPEFVWMRLRFQNELYGTHQYNTDGTLAASNDPTGSIIPVRVTPEPWSGRTFRLRDGSLARCV